ncbi:MAG: tetratricopeptide repeat protein [Gemmataceae bacterium]
MELTYAELAPIKALYASGFYRQAATAGEAYGPLRSWGGAGGRLLAGRLAMQLGAPRLGRKLHAVAAREYPVNLEAIYYSARYRMERFGPLACWRYMRSHADWSDASPDLRADWLSLSAFVAARLRDFERAERLLKQAETLAPKRAWVAVERASVLELAERHEDALASARESLSIHPWFRPGVQAVGHILQKLERSEEAVDVLREAAGRQESGLIYAQLAALLLDMDRPKEVGELLDRYEELSPLMEKEIRQWLAARRSDVSYLLGDGKAAALQARAVEEEFHTAFADALDNTTLPIPSRTIFAIPAVPTEPALPGGPLPTPYDSLSQYWNHLFPNPDPESEATTDGLPDAEERIRAIDAGWAVAEFTLSAESAHRLIAEKIPFLLTLVEVGVSQTRLCVGSDPIRQSIFLLDGVERKPAEAPISVLTTRYRSSGPRCMVVVPASESARLDALRPGLEEVAEYDALFAVQSALRNENRRAAGEAQVRLSAAHPGHRLAALGAIALARADEHPAKLLAAAEAAAKAFPDDSTLALAQAAALRDLGRLDERSAILRKLANKPEADPLIIQSLAQMMLTDPRLAYDVDRLLLRSVRVRPQAAAGYYLLASQWWERQRFAESSDLYRFACCLDDREEQFAEAYFRVARIQNQSPEAMRFFRDRLNRSEIPFAPAAKSLFTAHIDRDEPDEGFGMLAGAIEKAEAAGEKGKATLSELLLFRAEQFSGYGRNEEAAADLTAAQSKSAPVVWYKAAAKIARLRPDYTVAKSNVRKALELDPKWVEGHRVLAALLAETEGRNAAREYLAIECYKHFHNYPLLRLRAEFLAGEPDDSAISATKDLIQECPSDAWAHRQLALLLADRGRFEEAQAAVYRSAEIEPESPSRYAVAAHVFRTIDRVEDAISMLKEAVRSNPDFEPAIAELVNISRGRKEKGQALKYIAEQLRKKPHVGDGLIAYRDAYLNLAEDDDDHEKLLERLLKFNEARPDLWQSWSLVVQQYGIMHRLDEAHSLARETCERFPLAAKVWLDLAEVSRVRDHEDERIDALRHAVRASPGWAPAARELAEALKDLGEEEEAIAILERTVARNPLDPLARGFLAERLWDANRGEEAIEMAAAAVRHEPGYEWAWGAVADWGDRIERETAALDLARELSRERAGDARVWIKLARFLDDASVAVESLHALEKAVILDPLNADAHDLRAEKLAELGRFEEALAAARPPVFSGNYPINLQGRAAWIEARRGNFAAAIPPMQKLVSVNAEYVWGWHQLAEWYNETGRTKNFLEAAGELVRLRPEHPMPLALRGEAKLQAGDREGAKEDLRGALRANPRYTVAAALLFDACLADGEMRDARSALAVLQEHLEGPEVAVKKIKFDVKSGDSVSALEIFEEICHHDGETSPAVFQVSLAEFREVGWGDRCALVMREAVLAGPPFNPWSALFWLETEAGEKASVDERIALIDKVIEAYPKFASAYDRKAVLLAGSNRYDEAVAACKPEIYGDQVPGPLQGRAAWVEAERGNRREAVRQMTAILRDSPDYTWGWKMLAGWHEQAGEGPEFLRAAEQLVRLAPHDPVALLTRGTARRMADQRVGALEDFRLAFEMEPSFEEAGFQLARAQIESGDPDGATETLTQLIETSDGPLVRYQAVRAACARRDLTTARRHFRILAEHQKTPKSLLRDAVRVFDEEGWDAEATDELEAASTGQNPTPAAAALWAERSNVPSHRVKDIVKTNPAAAAEAILARAVGFVTAGQSTSAARVIEEFSSTLRENHTTWAKAGAVLTAGKLYPLAIQWLSDWKEREGLKAWMLLPLADSLRAIGNDSESLAIAKAGTGLDDDGDADAVFRGWLALDCVLAGRLEEAEAWLAPVDMLGKGDGVKLVLTMAKSILALERATDRPKVFHEAKVELKSAASICMPGEVPPGTSRWYPRVVAALAKSAGLRAKYWATIQRWKPWVVEG